MRKTMLMILLGALLLSACNLPTQPRTDGTQGAVATKVSQMLTSAPGLTPQLMTATSQPGSSTATPVPTATIASTATTAAATTIPTQAGPSPTTPAGDPKNSLGTPVWQATTDTSKSFYLYENQGTKVSADDGALVLTGLANNGWLGWSMTHSHPAQNFYLEATFKTQTCAGTDEYGLVFRAPSDEAGYFFSVTCDGKFSLDARDFTNNTTNTLIKLTPHSAIQPGANQTNRLGVMANGAKISLYANGLLLQEVNDTTFNPEKSYSGVQIAANQTAGFTVRMEEIALWKLP